jgi:hypothetical protein
LQQNTKHIPPNTHYNLPNQPLDFKFLLEGTYFEFFLKMYDWAPILFIPVIEIAHDMNEALKNTNVHQLIPNGRGEFICLK